METGIFGLLFVCIAAPGAAEEGVAPAGGAYAAWENGPSGEAGYFPIAVWLQDPRNAPKFKEAGINLYLGLWKGPTERQLDALRAAGMRVICAQNRLALDRRADPTIAGWMHGDEPDNAQRVRDPATGKQSYGPPVAPPKVVEDYRRIRSADPTRPVLLNLGQGVANDQWVGRGPGASLDDYPAYLKGCDVASFDVYPVAELDDDGLLWYVAKGVDRLARWSGGERITWNCIECTRISGGRRATPAQVRAQAWMSLVHGSRGLIYFVHQFKPTFIEAGLLADPEMLAAVTAINRQIHELAPVLNSPTVAGGVTVKSSEERVPIDVMMKRHGGAAYLFAVGMRNAPASATFEVNGLPARAEAEVLGEARRIAVDSGRFGDDFGPHAVHLYRVR
jgi:hypothetical protein